MGMFTRQSESGPVASVRGARFSFVGPEMSVTGNIATEGDLHIEGKIEGDVHCGALTLGESGEIRGNIVAGEARLGGLVDGAVAAAIVTLDHSARITGDILYGTLSISSGADVEGRFKRRKNAADGSSGARAEVARPPSPANLFAEAPPTAEAAE
ncbi:MAG TPA: polymer-forming cytoskeletal protein [Allosphingosinicella sp.]|jgi:cytoskeletal protein CcmA (bactofilin family)|nr:polymer-forming cytoskeletal protein [Allosphingosinicella sp.]